MEPQAPERLSPASATRAEDDEVVMTLVDLALGQPDAEREAYLRSACADDRELFDRVWHYVNWERRMNGFLLDPLYAPHLPEEILGPGQLLEGRFRIVREIARGGMGVVYEAFDEKLQRRIAIKCAQAGFHKRLPPEARHASEISHPNVCRIFEIHTASTASGEVEFLTMEFLEGETLTARLARGPLPRDQALAIALQLCDGVAAAHRHHIIHGDLKSSNIILTSAVEGGPRAVITDFGLAREPHTASQHGPSATTGGTPDYMAPELWRGERASEASDIYALGVILYELVSGRRPFGQPRDTDEAMASAERRSWEHRLSEKPPPVDAKWDRILVRCLDPDSRRRFPNAEQIAAALKPRSKRWMLGAAAALVVALGAASLTYLRATAQAETVTLALLPFAAPSDIAPVAGGVMQDAANQLARVASSRRTKFAFIPLNDVLRKHIATADQARASLRALQVLTATLVRDKDRITLHAAIADARSKATIRAWDASYTPAQMKYAGVALAGIVTWTFRLPPLARKTAVNAAASQEYAAGVTAVRRDTGIDAALAHFEKAVLADPDSPLPYAGRAEAEWFKYFHTKDRLWLDRTTESVRQAEARNPDLAEVHRVAGLLKSNEGWYEQAVAEYERAIELDPSNGDAYRRLGMALESNNQLDEAAIAVQKAIEANPQDYRSYQMLGELYFGRAKYDEAGQQFAKAVEIAPDEAAAHFSLASAYTNLGRFAEAESQLRRALALQESPAAINALGLVLMYERRESEAIPYFLEVSKLAPGDFITWIDLSICYRRTNRPSDAAQASRKGLDAVQAEIAKNPRDGQVRSYLAYLAAANGDRMRAESEIAQAQQLSPSVSDAKWMAVLTYEVLGRRDASLAVLASAPTEILQDLSRWPDVADLSKDSRFTNLLIARGVK